MAKDDISFSKNEREFKFGSKCIGISSNKTKFNFRVACIVERDGQVLLHKQKKDDFWNLIGGRLKYCETCEEAIRRELKEEIGCECKSAKILRVCENFFEFKGTRFHEMLVIFGMELLGDIKKENIEEKIEIKWFSKQELESIKIKPEFAKKMMLEKEEHLGWLVNDEIRSFV